MDSAWTREELDGLNRRDELELTIAGKSVTIWMVTVEGEAFVRSVHGRDSKWFQRALTQLKGEASAGGMSRSVRLFEPDQRLQSAIDSAFRTKYRRYAKSIVDSTVSAVAQGAALQLVPQD